MDLSSVGPASHQRADVRQQVKILSDMAQRIQLLFFDFGTQYYVSARFSAFAFFTPVSGNLFHHAIEMYLKGYLSSSLSLAEMKKLGHRLQKIWDRFKTGVADPSLDHFDSVIAELNKFEDIRYPDRVLSHGMSSTVSINKHASLSSTAPNSYTLVVEELDGLVGLIFKKSGVNPSFFFNSLKAEAKTYLNKGNKVVIK